MTAYRLPAPYGRFLDRDREIAFTFEGARYQGFGGDTLMSALMASGRHLVSRSFKYHRPRGPITLAGLDCNTYVQHGSEPNALADRLGLYDGLTATAQNVNGSLDQDRDAWIQRVSKFLPVGFYYKAFYKPKGVWNHWEKFVRAKAGLGVVDRATPHDDHDKAYMFADVAVIGGGAAGLAAAMEAAHAGCEVLLIDDQPRLGGALNYARFDGDPERGPLEAQRLLSELEGDPNVTLLTDARLTGWFADNWLSVIRGNRLIKLRAKQVVLATGALEQPMVFHNNDLPGIVTGSAAQRAIHLWAVKPGQRAVVATGNRQGYEAALDLHDAGVEVAAILDLNREAVDCPARHAAEKRGLKVLANHAVWEAHADATGKRLGSVVPAKIVAQGEVGPATGEPLACDLLAVSVGWSPLAQPLCHVGGRLVYDDDLAALRIDHVSEGAQVAGAVNGAHDLTAVLAEGRRAGWAAARAAGAEVGEQPPAPEYRGEKVNHPWPIFPHPKGKDFVDIDEDQTVQDIHNAIADGFEHVELMKRYTTVGMGPSQGRTSALNAVRITARANGATAGGTTVTTQRPPFVPESFGHLAGRSFEPERFTAMHHRHLGLGAEMMPAGLWWRPAYYDTPEDREAAILREAWAVRENVGLIDVSTLGGIDIRGSDVREFMQRMYTFNYLKQPVGKSRYVLMCDHAGAIADDGVAACFAEDHFYVTATTGGVDGVYRSMLRWNAEWRLDVDITNVTAAYAGINIAGPNARKVLATLETDLDLSPEGFPYLAVRMGAVAGIPVRVLRVGFVGELGYELHCPASYGEALWDILMAAGKPFDIQPFGVEAQRLLRLEKGHIIIGQDTDGLTTPHEADMAWAVGRKKPFFIGQRAVDVQARNGLTRKLTGFLMPKDSPVPEECNLVIRNGEIAGRVTSAARSVGLPDRIVGLAYVHPDDAEPGKTFHIKLSDGRTVEATAAAIPFYDPESKRQEL